MDQALLLASRRHQCGRLLSLSTLDTASPASGSSRWADISDADGSDTESSYGEDRFSLLPPLPETTVIRSSSLEVSSPLQARAALNASAPEFLPTLSMECQVVGVGYCNMICEESSLEPELGMEESSSFQMHYVTDQSSASLHKAKKPFWKRQRPPQVDIQATSSSSEALQEHEPRDINTQRRLRNIQAGKETKEYQWHMEQVRLHGPGVEPLTPDPTDRKISKRSWDYAVREWRAELRKGYETFEANHPEGFSVASTESTEADSHRSEIDDSATASDDGSFASL